MIGLAFDRSTVRTVDKDGRLHVAITNISKANVCPYLGREIPDAEELGLDPNKTYFLYRDPDELAKAAPTFNNIPLLSKHVPVNAGDHQPDLVVGSTGTDAEFESPYLRNSLVIWAQPAIDGVESEDQKELSSAYRYRVDMTPGTVGGEKYDGVMRDIIGNHVALVKEGRAGPDVVVGDAMPLSFMENIAMTKTILSRKGALAFGALAGYLKPKMAQDAKIDFAPALVGLTQANFKTKKPSIIAALNESAKGKLAKDASLDDLTNLLDAIESAEVVEGADTDPESGMPVNLTKLDDKTMDADPIAKIKAFLKGKISDEDLAQIDGMVDAPKAADESEEDKKKREDEEASKRAKDELEAKEKDKNMVTKPAMDAAIAAATKAAHDAAVQTQREIRDAERAVRPYVGELAMAHDSAEAVYRTALGALGVKVDGVHTSALPVILGLQPVPGAKPARVPVAQDSADEKEYAERFPNARRLKA